MNKNTGYLPWGLFFGRADMPPLQIAATQGKVVLEGKPFWSADLSKGLRVTDQKIRWSMFGGTGLNIAGTSAYYFVFDTIEDATLARLLIG